MNTLDNSPDALWKQIAPMLDDAIDVLDGTDRQAIVLRFFERRDFRSIGHALGVTDDAAQKRVSRALEKLRELLGKRGVTLPSVLLTGLMAGRTVSAAPAGLAAQVSNAALLGVASGAGLAMLLAKMTSSLGFKLATAAIIVGTAAWLFLPHAPTQSSTPARQETPDAVMDSSADVPTAVLGPITAAEFAMPTVAQNATDLSDGFLLTVVSAETGQPIPDAEIESWIWSEKGPAQRNKLRTSAPGACSIPVSRDSVTRFILTAKAEGFAITRLEWRPERGATIPHGYTMRLGNAVPIGGVVLDAEGRPVGGAEVGFNNDVTPDVETYPQSELFGWPFRVTATTDADGRWEMNTIGKSVIPHIRGSASHPEHVSSEYVWVNRTPEALKTLLAREHVFTLGQAVVVRGIVVDSNDKPIADAKVLAGRIGESGRRESTTAVDGTFALAGCKPGRNLLTASADGYASTTREVEFAHGAEPFRLVLQPGKSLRLLVVSTEGAPIPNASVWLDTINQNSGQRPATQADFSGKTGPDGRLEWMGAPDEELSFNVSAQGCIRVSDMKVHPDGTEHVITLPPALTISGTVRDEQSGEPVPRFRIITGWPNWNPLSNETNSHWSNIDRFWLTFSGGTFQHVYEEPVFIGPRDPEFVFKFEAEGYAPSVTRVVKAAEKEVRFDVILRPAVATEVTVLQPDGRPAAVADIGLVTGGAGLKLVPGGFSRDSVSGGNLLRTGENGRVRLPGDSGINRVIAAHANGYAEAAIADLVAGTSILLQPWGRVEGVLLSNGIPAAGQDVRFKLGGGVFGTVSEDFTAYTTRTDSQGRFTFSKAPAGKHKIVVMIRHEEGSTTSWGDGAQTDVEVLPGETVSLTVEGNPSNAPDHAMAH